MIIKISYYRQKMLCSRLLFLRLTYWILLNNKLARSTYNSARSECHKKWKVIKKSEKRIHFISIIFTQRRGTVVFSIIISYYLILVDINITSHQSIHRPNRKRSFLYVILFSKLFSWMIHYGQFLVQFRTSSSCINNINHYKHPRIDCISQRAQPKASTID